jgi:hypothetical protein
MLAFESQTLPRKYAILLNSHAVLVLSVSLLSRPGSFCLWDSIHKGRLPRRYQHAAGAVALAEILDMILPRARQILRRVLRSDCLRLRAIVPPLLRDGVSVSGSMARMSGRR